MTQSGMFQDLVLEGLTGPSGGSSYGSAFRRTDVEAGQSNTARAELLVSAAANAYFTAPAVRPETMRRWNARTSMVSGTVTTMEAAACAP